MRRLALVLVGCAVAACADHDADTSSAAGGWVGTITTEGDVTTVVNESGSVWGGTARLVEEASIGLEEGPEELMLGRLGGIGMTQERIFVLDGSLHLIRSYDADGNHLADCGGPGQGPGELDRSGFVAPQLGTSPDGRVFAQAGNEIEVFSVDCQHLETRVFRERFIYSAAMVVTEEGVPYVPFPTDREGHPVHWTYGMQAVGGDGPVGEPIPQPSYDFEREDLELRTRLNSGGVTISRSSPPFVPDLVWAMMPSGGMVGGVSSGDRFELIQPDGRRIKVENTRRPVRLQADEADWHARRYLSLLHAEEVVDPPSWSVSELREIKPPFDRFVPDRSGRVWVLRPGPGEHVPDCNDEARTLSEFRESPCWEDPTIVEVFGTDGRYLGPVDVPEEMLWSPVPYIRDDVVVAVVEDEAGTIMVKRYRLAMPAQQE